MISKTDQIILAELRKDARISLSDISRKTGIPVSTVFDRMKRIEKEYVARHTSLLDFSRLGHSISVMIFLKTDSPGKLREFLSKHRNVNSVFRVTNGYDFLAEAVFKDMKQLEDFNDSLAKFGIKERMQFHTIETLKKEGFLAR